MSQKVKGNDMFHKFEKIEKNITVYIIKQFGMKFNSYRTKVKNMEEREK